MHPKITHPWNLTVEEAQRLQRGLSAQVREQDELPETVRLIAGADVHPVSKEQMQAVVCVLTFPELELVEAARAVVPAGKQRPLIERLMSEPFETDGDDAPLEEAL